MDVFGHYLAHHSIVRGKARTKLRHITSYSQMINSSQQIKGVLPSRFVHFLEGPVSQKEAVNLMTNQVLMHLLTLHLHYN